MIVWRRVGVEVGGVAGGWRLLTEQGVGLGMTTYLYTLHIVVVFFGSMTDLSASSC